MRNRLLAAMIPMIMSTSASAPSMMYAKVLICSPNRVSMIYDAFRVGVARCLAAGPGRMRVGFVIA